MAVEASPSPYFLNWRTSHLCLDYKLARPNILLYPGLEFDSEVLHWYCLFWEISHDTADGPSVTGTHRGLLEWNLFNATDEHSTCRLCRLGSFLPWPVCRPDTIRTAYTNDRGSVTSVLDMWGLSRLGINPNALFLQTPGRSRILRVYYNKLLIRLNRKIVETGYINGH